MDASQPDAHLGLLAVGGSRLRSRRTVRLPVGSQLIRHALSCCWSRARIRSRCRLRRVGSRRALGSAVDGLERHVVAHLVVHIQQLVERHAVELCERDEVVGVGRRLRALPLRHSLARHAQLLRERFLRQSRLLATRRQALGDLDVHGSEPFLVSFIIAYSKGYGCGNRRATASSWNFPQLLVAGYLIW